MSEIKSPYNIKKRAGRNINAAERAVLRQIEDLLHKQGYEVLGSLFARVPGMLKFFATTYKTFAGFEVVLPPFGVTCVNLLNNGDVTYKVMGCEPGSCGNATSDVKWK